MAEDKELFVCKYNLRPRIDGKAVLILAGKPFEKEVVDEATFKAMIDAGSITAYEPVDTEETVVEDFVIEEDAPAEPTEAEKLEAIKAEALKEFGVELKSRKVETAQKALDDLRKKAANKPQGIFNLNVDDLADKTLDELDAIHTSVCADNELPSPDPFEDIEQAIDKLTSEA